jgi:hypothetical protein
MGFRWEVILQELFSGRGIFNSLSYTTNCNLNCTIQTCPEVKDWKICSRSELRVAKLLFRSWELEAEGLVFLKERCLLGVNDSIP